MITFLTYNGNDAPTAFELAGVGLNARRVARWIRAVAAEYGYSVGNINYLLCNDEQILAVNREFLQHDYYTDVITFDYTTAQCLNGDIFISLDTVRSNAEMVGAAFDHELLRIFIHGILHLTGQADKTPDTKAEMTRKEEAALLLIMNYEL
ncbi:MAG: rRNA maturation RNase YbeY [Paludibacteraceae bacterium]